MAASTAVGEGRTPLIPQEDHRAQVAVLTGLRGFAALMVVLVHSAGRTDYTWIGLQGYGPVSLFVLSGFLLFQPFSRWTTHQADRPSLRTFARRRAYRIFPAYLVAMLAFALLYPKSQPNGVDGWLRGLTLTGTSASDGLRPGLEQTWSLGTELSWYIVMPVFAVLVALVTRRLSPRRSWWVVTAGLASSVLVTIAWRWYVEANHLGPKFTYSFWIPGFLVCFAGGAFVGHLLMGERVGVVSLHRLRAFTSRTWLVIAVAVLAAVVGASELSGPTDYVPATFQERQIRFVCAMTLAIVLLLAAATAPTRSLVNRFLSARWLVATGRWSYGIYLWHLPVIVMLNDEFKWRSGPWGAALWLATILAISVPLGAMSWAWVERPAIARSKRVRPAPAAAP